jgi:hypothetical protein
MRWRRIARAISDAQARILLTIVYYIVLPVFVVAIRFGEDPFRSGWHARNDSEPACAAKRQS